MKLNARNLPKMNAKQKAQYRKHLAQVRKYVADRYEWQRKIKKGQLDKKFTLQQYRNAKYSGNATALPEIKPGQFETDDTIQKLENLLRQLKNAEEIKNSIRDQLRGIK